MTTTATVNSSPITATVSGATVSASVTSSSSSVSAAGGVGPQGPAGAAGVAGVAGVAGATGATGSVGAAGPANTLAIGTVTSGSSASATITGSSPSQTLNLVLPRGEAGNDGAAGATGSQGIQGIAGSTGPAGPANTLSIGTVSSGETAAATITGASPSQVLNLVLPKGDTGSAGVAGATGSVGPQGPAGIVGATGPQGPAASLNYPSVADFPATGSGSALYLAEDTSRIYQWESPVYVEIGVSGGGGSLIDGNKGDITVSGNGAAWAINSDAVTDAKIAGVAASKLTGTIADARLSSSVLLASALAARQHQTASFIDATDRIAITTAVPPVSNAVYWTFFTPAYTLTISQIAFACTTAASGVTLCRYGLYTADAAGNATLVARTASDTTIFNTSNTVFTRSLDTTGGYPSSYTLTAGTRYAVSICIAAANTGAVSGVACPGVIAALSPRVQGVRTGANDILTSQGSGQYNGTVGHIYWARLS